MRKIATLFVALTIAASLPTRIVRAQDSAAQEAQKNAAEPAREEHGEMEGWKWANFGLLVLALGYMIGKNAGPFFASRSRKIRQEMIEADAMRKDADERAESVNRRLANLEADIAALRKEAAAEAESEAQRTARHTADELAKIRHQTEQEIASVGKAARMELKRYSAELAVALAGKRVSARMTPQTQDALVHSFVRDLESPKSSAQSH